jgi:hypothetical protein
MIKTNLQAAAPARGGAPVLDFEARLADAKATVREALTPALVPLLGRYRAEIAHATREVPYRWFPAAVRALQAELLGLGGEAFAAAHAALMVESIADFDRIAPAAGYPASIRAEFDRVYARILGKIASADWTGYAGDDDRLWKDFGLARQRLLPVEAWAASPNAAYQRGFLLAAGLQQFLAALPFMRGNRGWVTCHLNEFEKDRFNEAGFRSMVKMVADLLRARPELNGLFLGASWLYSPELPTISPRLDFHRRLALPAGARIFFVSKGGADSLALAASETRRRAFAEGRYRPDNYILLWRRADLLAWADAQRS